MKGIYWSLAIVALALSSCVISRDFDRDNDRSRDYVRRACLDLAHEQGYRKVEVQPVQSIGAKVGPRTWEMMMRGTDSTGREVKLACEFDGQRRRAALGRVD